MKDFSKEELHLIHQALIDKLDALECEMGKLYSEMCGQDMSDTQIRYRSILLEACKQTHYKLYKISAKIDAKLTSITVQEEYLKSL
jgi:hypothetical protein